MQKTEKRYTSSYVKKGCCKSMVKFVFIRCNRATEKMDLLLLTVRCIALQKGLL